MLAVLVCLSLLGGDKENLESIVLSWEGRSLPVVSYQTIAETCSLVLSHLEGSEERADQSNRVPWLLRRGQALYILGKDQEAMRDLSECYRLLPNDDHVAFAYARCALTSSKDTDGSLNIAERLVRTARSEAMGQYLIGAHAAHAHEYDRALKCFDDAVRLSPDWMLARLGRGHCEYALGRYHECVVDLDQVLNRPEALSTSPNNIRRSRACALVGLDRYEDAYIALTEVYRNAVEDKDISVVCETEKALWFVSAWLEKYRECAYLAERRIELVPNDPIGYRQAALAYATLGKPDLAKHFAEEMIRLAVSDCVSWGTLARVYYQRGDFENALRCFMREFKDSTQDDPALPEDAARCAFLLATCPDPQIRNANVALKYLDRAVKTGPLSDENNTQVMALRAICLAEMGQTAAATELMDKAMKIPQRPGESRSGFATLRQVFSEGRAYHHDPLSPESHLFSVLPAEFVGAICLRLPLAEK